MKVADLLKVTNRLRFEYENTGEGPLLSATHPRNNLEVQPLEVTSSVVDLDKQYFNLLKYFRESLSGLLGNNTELKIEKEINEKNWSR